MELQLRPRFVLLIGVLIAASGCTTETPPLIPEDARVVAPDGSIPMRDGGTPPTCEAGLIDCEGECTNVAADSANCGSCRNACPRGLSCAIGRCDCAEPMLGCEGLCIDPSTDRANCGECGRACATDETCVAGTCVVECDAPAERCTSVGEDGEPVSVCAEVQNDPMNCGSCGTQCNGGGICEDGRCACPSGQLSCSGTCTDLSTDANNCGTCLNSCGAGGVCVGGECETCGTGLSACGSPARCADTMTSRLHCGACDNTCGPGEGCNGGTCECLPGFTDCEGVCANLTGDPRNCGGCGIDCGRGGTCSAGVCTCAAGATMCGAECAELDIDSTHCGGCDTACAEGEACYSGDCLPVNDSCATARPVTGNLVIDREAIEDGGARPTGTNCGSGSGALALYYAVTIRPGEEVAVTTTTSGDLVLFEQAACGPTCTRSTDFPESLTLSNVFGTEDVTRIVGVRAYGTSTPTYNVSFMYSTPVVATNALCTAATAVTADTAITGENTAEGGPRPTGTNCGFGSAEKALYYSVTIPMGQEVAVTADAAGDVVLFEQAACSDTTCAQSSDFPEALTLSNVFGTGPVTRIVAVRGYSSNSTYDITFAYSTPVVAPNASCAAATAVSANTTITGEDIATGGPRATGSGCGGGSGPKALYYAVTIPAGQQVVATVDAAGDVVVFEQAACSDTTCTRSSDFPEELTLSNVFGTAPVTRIMGVRAWTTATTYDIEFAYSTPIVAANALCTAATAVTATTTIAGEDTEAGGPRPTGTDCGDGSATKALYYAVTVPAGSSVSVQATPVAGVDLVIFEQAACSDTICTDSYDDGITSEAESMTLSNTAGTSDVTHIIGVRGYNAPGGSFPGGVFDIAFTYTP